MKTLFDHIEHVKGKPHHIRKRVAFGVATFGSALIALVWLVGSYSSGAFVIKGSSFAMSTGQDAVVATTSAVSDQGLAGVGAAAALSSDTNVPAHIEIVDTAPAKTQQAEPTTLSF